MAVVADGKGFGVSHMSAWTIDSLSVKLLPGLVVLGIGNSSSHDSRDLLVIDTSLPGSHIITIVIVLCCSQPPPNILLFSDCKRETINR